MVSKSLAKVTVPITKVQVGGAPGHMLKTRICFVHISDGRAVADADDANNFPMFVELDNWAGL